MNKLNLLEVLIIIFVVGIVMPISMTGCCTKSNKSKKTHVYESFNVQIKYMDGTADTVRNVDKVHFKRGQPDRFIFYKKGMEIGQAIAAGDNNHAISAIRIK